MNTIKVPYEIHQLPGVEDVNYVYNRDLKELTVNVNGVEVHRYMNGEAQRIYNLATDDDFKNMESVIKRVALFFGVEPEDIAGRTRIRKVSDARFCFVRIVRDNTDLSFHEIGKFLNRDHATLIWAYRQVENVPEINNKYKNFKYWLEKKQVAV